MPTNAPAAANSLIRPGFPLRIGITLGLMCLGACSNSSSSAPQTSAQAGLSPDMQAKVALDIATRVAAAGDNSQAIALYRSVASSSSKWSKSAGMNLGGLLIAGQDFSGALDAYRNVLASAPRDAAALAGLGTAYVALDEPIPGRDALQKSLAIAPSARATSALTVALDLQGQTSAAIALAQSGVVQFPGDLALRNNLALSQALAGQFDAAIATMQAVIASADAQARDRLNLALILGMAGRNQAAARTSITDLAAASVQDNLGFYAQLRALPASEQAQTLLHPHKLVMAIADNAPNISPTIPPATPPGTPPGTTADSPQLAIAAAPVVTVAQFNLPASARPATASPTAASTPAHLSPASPADQVELNLGQGQNITVIGAKGTDIITVGSPSQTVIAGNGTYQINAPATLAGVAVIGNEHAHTTLRITSNGKAHLNRKDRNLVVVLHNASAVPAT
jgi:Flp pilus assembly protein TadD